MTTLRSSIAIGLIVAIVLLAGCTTNATTTDDTSPEASADSSDVPWLSVVDDIKVHGDTLSVIHDERQGTYCYTLNDYDGDGLACEPTTPTGDY
jgi:uncharacterized lipoprotein YajG